MLILAINFKLIRLIYILSFILLFPYVQKQWFNLSLLNQNNYSFYSIIYYLSGLVCPLVVFFGSLKEFTYHKFQTSNNKTINGKSLLLLILFLLLPLSFITQNYFYNNLELFFNIFFNTSFLSQISFIQNIYIFFVILILFIFKNTRIFIKKITLINFILFAILIWHAKINYIFIKDKFFINSYLNLANENLINIIYLIFIELLFYSWSYISYKNNLSNWEMPIPFKREFISISKILIFYFFMIVYYLLI